LPFQRSIPAPGPAGAQKTIVGHVMSPGAVQLSRPNTNQGVGVVPSAPEIPAPPLTEVAPAPAVRHDLLASAPDVELELSPEPVAKVRPRPSETMVGSRSPLHTAEDANTIVDASTLTADDAERILAAADADGRAGASKRAATLLAPAAGLPPPPSLRRSSIPPPRAGAPDPFPSGLPRPSATPSVTSPAPSPAASPVAARGRSSFPPPQRRSSTLLIFGGAGGDPASPGNAPTTDPGSIRALLTKHANASEPPPPRPPPAAAQPPTPEPPPPARPRAPSAEEISAGFLLDDTGGHVVPPPPVPISSSSLVEDPPSSPELELEEDEPPLAAYPPAAVPQPFSVASDPFPSVPPPPPMVTPDQHRVFPAVAAADAAALAFVEAPTQEAPLELVALGESIGEPSHFDRPTAPPMMPRPPPRIAFAPPPRPTWLVPVLTIGGAALLAIGVGCVAFVVKWVHSAVVGKTSAPVASSIAALPSPSASTAPGAVASADVPSVAPCILAGAPHVIAPRALLRAGIETASSVDHIAVGMALADRDGLVVSLDPSTFSAISTSRSHADDPLKRVVPLLSSSSNVTEFFETTHAGKRPSVGLAAAHPLVADPPFILGVEDGAVVWAPSRTAATTQLWPLAGDTPVDAIRAVELPKHSGFAVAFRQGTSIYLGGLNSDRTVNGGLAHIAGLGPQIGAPAIAASSDHVLVAWADRASPSAPWAIRWLTWHPGTEPVPASPFPVPPGGSGGQAMSPSLTSLSGGRVVMAWTEGGGARHEVRAQALDSSEHFLGTTLTVSAEGVNAGQGVPALTPDGRGAVVFLANPTASTASVVAVPILCLGSGG